MMYLLEETWPEAILEKTLVLGTYECVKTFCHTMCLRVLAFALACSACALMFLYDILNPVCLTW